jgi:hypothetical protein
MFDLGLKNITKREFLRIFGLSSASLFASGSLADELLAEVRGAGTPVVVMIRPNAFRLGRSSPFSSIVVFPEGYEAAHVDVSSVRCEGACALDSIWGPDGRIIGILHDSGHLRDDLPCGFSVPFTVTGQLLDGSVFEGSDTVAVIDPDQSIIYHTSTRKRRSCGACKGHALNRIYSSRQAAEGDRAHPGCNCRIVEERINWRDYVRAFWPGSQGGEAVYDRRWGWPPSSPAELCF